MLTQCPGCQTVFRVTGAILKVAHGQVRCGRCSTQFDALECMLPDDVEAALEPAPLSNPESAQTEQIVVEEPQTHEEITLEGKHIEISGVYRVLDGDPEHPHTRTIVEEFDFNDGAEQDPPPPESVTNETIVNETEITASTDAAAELPPASELNAARQAFAAARQEIEDSPTHDRFFEPPHAPVRSNTAWSVASGLLTLLLVSQTIHHYREDLARHPTVGPWLTKTYRTLGLSLTPNWDLHAYEVQQWGVVSDPNAPGTLKVRAGITNKGVFAQPYPLLKLVLEDRWGGEIGSREFEPREYLPATTASDRMLAPRQAANAEIAIVDPGEDAVGFRVDACLRRDKGVACASEQSAG